MPLPVTLLALLSFLALSLSAQASTLSFIESTTASGSLNGVSFTETSLTITGTFDTSLVTSNIAQGFQSAPTLLTYTIDGFGSVTSDGVNCLCPASVGDYIFVNQRQSGAGVGDTSNGSSSPDVMDTSNGAYASLSLLNPFGPIVGTDLFSNTDLTTGGLLQIVSTGNVTMTTFPTAASATPEPSSLILLATGLTGIAAAGRRGFKP